MNEVEAVRQRVTDVVQLFASVAIALRRPTPTMPTWRQRNTKQLSTTRVFECRVCEPTANWHESPDTNANMTTAAAPAEKTFREFCWGKDESTMSCRSVFKRTAPTYCTMFALHASYTTVTDRAAVDCSLFTLCGHDHSRIVHDTVVYWSKCFKSRALIAICGNCVHTVAAKSSLASFKADAFLAVSPQIATQLQPTPTDEFDS